ncbi:hypothetical protein ACQCWJ_27000 [Bacillus thuringiensis]|uniref:protein Dhp61 n=1 Tax=Bacillus cereus group TaxID=86661 RepID=UPI00124D2100|nr:hypothetical protein [Bacillus cereus]KAB2429193.1 hypothetical protein F8168_14490 [Bacillus cereus]
MKEKIITSYANLELAYIYKFVTIDLNEKFFKAHVVNAKTKATLLEISIDIINDKVITEGNIHEYPFDIDDVVDTLKTTANLCIENKLTSQFAIDSYIEDRVKKEN